MITLERAFSLAPLGTIELGGVEYPLPPLTFGRFQALLACELPDVAKAATERDASGYAQAAESVLSIPAAVWREHGTMGHVYELFWRYKEAHDWKLIQSCTGMGEKRDESRSVDATGLARSLMAFCRMNPGYVVEDLLRMRVEGFFLLMHAGRPEPEEPVPQEIPAGVVAMRDPAAASRLDAVLANAQRVS